MHMFDATRPVRFLLVLWDGGGNIPPQLAVARRLVERGHDVRILAPRVLQPRIEAAGCHFVPYQRAPEHESASAQRDLIKDWQPRTPLGASARVRDRLMAAPALAFAQDIQDVLEQEPADVIVLDYLILGGYLAAERLGVPLAALIHHIYPFPDPAMPPFGMGFRPAGGVAGRTRDAVFRRLFVRFYGGALPAINAARTALDLAPLGSVFDLFSQADRLLVLSSRALDFPAAALPENVRYVGVQADVQAVDAAWDEPWETDDHRPLVVVSLSTTFQRQDDVLHRIMAALGTLPVRALVTAGPAVDCATLPRYDNIVVRSYVPHSQVFPQAELVMTHGGHGTVATALGCGVPVLCLPMGRDQADVAARVVWRGAGLALSSRSKPQKVRAAVLRMLEDPRSRVQARRIAADMARGDGEISIVDELESLASVDLPIEAALLAR
jgi:MGT family glycosyltransferase